MLALTRYQLAVLGHSQRYLPPTLVYLASVGIVFNHGSAPVVPEFAVTAGALCAVACWLTVALVDAEDPIQRLVTKSHTRRRGAVPLAVACSVLICCAALTTAVVLWVLWRRESVEAGSLGFGVLAQSACSCLGVAIGLACSRLLVPRIGYSVLIAVFALLAVLFVRPIPLVNPMLRAMGSNENLSTAVPLGAAASALALALTILLVTAVSARRS
ncbi:hypothetical protein SAMN05216266_101636 [Amycolatopsis marina]|uniref:ABC-2 type transport system permease protein n=1 Tax=Amycolatopsis marina TaxID=490629 RepID=A0A1I0W066_9PSEU|nr:hypothetical protein [Amycolatopsis marina]SFA82001.1 hypothetical protein SAMN05216266_101636 [Amycolatopsis marina]